MKPSCKLLPASAFVILMSAFAFSAAAQNPGHPPSQIGPGTFAGSGTWTFPGNIVASGTICGSAGCAGSGGTGGTCACPWTAQNPPGLFYSGGAGVSGDLWANRICENGGTSCVSIDAIGTGGGTCSCQWLAQSPGTYYANNAGVGGNLQAAGNLIGNALCDTETPSTCIDVKTIGTGGGSCTCPTTWLTATGGIYYSSGKVAIGAADLSGNYRLRVRQASNNPGDGLTVENTDASKGMILWADASNALIDARNGANIQLRTSGGSTRIYVRGTDGFVGIGTNTPGEVLDVSGNIKASGMITASGDICTSTKCLNSVGGSTSQWQTGSYGIYYSGTPNKVGINGQPGSNALELYVNGDVGASNYCDASGNNCHPIADLINVAAAANPWTAGTGAIYYNSGNVGIGTTSPTQRLDVRVGATNDKYLFRNDNNVGFELRSETTGGTPYIDFANDASSDFDIRIIQANDDLLRIDGGNLGVTTYCDASGANCFRRGIPIYKVTAKGCYDASNWFLDGTEDNTGTGMVPMISLSATCQTFRPSGYSSWPNCAGTFANSRSTCNNELIGYLVTG